MRALLPFAFFLIICMVDILLTNLERKFDRRQHSWHTRHLVKLLQSTVHSITGYNKLTPTFLYFYKCISTPNNLIINGWFCYLP